MSRLAAVRRSIFLQVLLALVFGALLGVLAPNFAEQLKPLGEGFIKLIRMLVAPLVFLVVVQGISAHSDLRRLGRIAAKAILYFEAVTLLALAIGLLVAQGLHLGAGMAVGENTLSGPGALPVGQQSEHMHGVVDFLLGLIPQSFVGAFVGGDILQVLLLAILFAVALNLAGSAGAPVAALIQSLSTVMFRLMGLIIALAPLGVLGSVAYMVGHFGLGSLAGLLGFLAAYFAVCLLFVVLVLGAISRLAGISLWQLCRYLSAELSIVAGTTSADVVLPRLMEKLQALGISHSTVGLVVPLGYSFNLDGFSIYLTLAVVFLANASGVSLGWGELLLVLLVAMLTSKGAHGIPGSALVILAATLSAVPAVPATALALLLPIDWFIGIARALTNVLGNSVAVLVIARWENDLDPVEAGRRLRDG